jgi:hypothetical protein
MNRTRGRRTSKLLTLTALVPALAWSAPTPPPPAPAQPLGQVTVVQETPGTMTVIDSAGRTHYLMRRIKPADRKAAAARAKATREAKANARKANP